MWDIVWKELEEEPEEFSGSSCVLHLFLVTVHQKTEIMHESRVTIMISYMGNLKNKLILRILPSGSLHWALLS